MIRSERSRIAKCRICGKISREVSEVLGVCLSCIRNKPEESLEISKKVHMKVRREFGLPEQPPRSNGGIECKICSNNCKIGNGETGYCGLRRNIGGRLETLEGVITAYYDSLPTNCCASWFCPGSKEIGYNLAVFPYGCSFNCLFCQNWEHKLIDSKKRIEVEDLVEMSRKAYCVCYFGGTPEPQLPFLLEASKRILEERKVRICWEWNSTGNGSLVKRAAEMSYESGGIIKFDIKAFDKNLHMALTGRPNDSTLENFEYIAENFDGNDLLTATTLLVPGYIDKKEVEDIAKFISSLNPNIPYSLLVFHPDFKMMDLPVTPRRLVYECYSIAKKYLRRVNIGNLFLLEEFRKF